MPIGTSIREGNTYVHHGLFIEPGEQVITYKHKRPSEMLLAHGSVLVDHFGDARHFTAPALIPLEAEKHYAVTAMTHGTILCCIHHLKDGETVPPVMEND